MRESLAAALGGLQSLSYDDHRERPVDRLAALAYAQSVRLAGNSQLASLGVDLIALKYARREASKDPATQKLSDILGWRSNRLDLNEGQYLRVSRWAVAEWLHEACLCCRGAKEIPDYENVEGAQPMKPCPECVGTGVRKWTDQERLEALGGDYGKPLDLAHKYIGAGAAEAIRGALKMLERWT